MKYMSDYCAGRLIPWDLADHFPNRFFIGQNVVHLRLVFKPTGLWFVTLP